MSQIKGILLLAIIICVLSSCAAVQGGRIVSSDDDRMADARMEQVIEAVKTQDKEALKAMFSEKIINEATDFDKNLDHLYEFIQGEIDSWESTGSYGASESTDYGRRTKIVSSYYYVNTDKQRYFFLLDDCPIDTEQPENVGFHLLLVVKEEDEEKIWDSSQKIIYDGDTKLSPVGICIPFE